MLLLSLVIDITWSAGSTPGTLAVRTFFICPKLTFIYPISYMDEIFYELSMDHRDYKNASAYQNFRGLRPAYRPQNCPKLTFIYPISYMDEIFHELSMDHRDYKNAPAYQNFRGLHPAYRTQNFLKRSFIYPMRYIDEYEFFHKLSIYKLRKRNSSPKILGSSPSILNPIPPPKKKGHLLSS